MHHLLASLMAVLPGLVPEAERAGPAGSHAVPETMHAPETVSKALTGEGTGRILPLQVPARPRRICGTVFGYLPYWESADHLRYDLLTHLACFGVAVHPDGSLGNDRGWPWIPVINAAHAEGVKIILVATLFNPEHIEALITDPDRRATFFVNIRNKLLEGSADGLNIDFEGGGRWRSRINGFMADLTAYLHAEIPGCEVTFAGPAVNWGNAWDLAGLAASCDGIFIMGYALAGDRSSHTGPNAPLNGGRVNLTDTVFDVYGQVTEHSPEKLILGVPYFGHHWIAESSGPRAGVVTSLGSTRFRQDGPKAEQHGLLWESLSQTPWYRWQEQQVWHQVWFDNAESLGLKYELARDAGLQGVGIWALGYDGDREELWNELDHWYGSGCFAAPDFDADHDVDQDDFGHFLECLTGRGVPQTDPECRDALLDLDGDIDQDDFAIFQGCVSGPNLAPPDHCVPANTPRSRIPSRPGNAVTGTRFISDISALSLAGREARIAREITAGNIPDFLRVFAPVTVSTVVDGTVHTATFEVTPDYLCVGSDTDFVRMPMTPATAQTIADRFRCILPTRKMVDAVYEQAAVRLAPSPISPDTTDITSVSTFYRHHQMIETQRAGNATGPLLAGIKKDVVLTTRLIDRPGKVAIYGWHRLGGAPIQPLYLGHVDWYVDYSHGVRLVRNRMILDGRHTSVAAVLAHPVLHVLLSDEGPVNRPYY